MNDETSGGSGRRGAPELSHEPPSGALCPSCTAALRPGDHRCASCGAPVGDVAPAAGTAPGTRGELRVVCTTPGCGGIEFADGRCVRCGQREPGRHDRFCADLTVAAALSDKGLHHTRNDDAFQIAREGAPDGSTVLIGVVCDGVSTAAAGDEAARTAAQVVADGLAVAARAGTDLAVATRQAVGVAFDAVAEIAARLADGSLTDEVAGSSPATTLVSVAITADRVVVGWLGDSRVYWLDAAEPRTGSRVLTADDSWAHEMVAAGLLDEEAAQANPRAHAITRWIGTDADQGDPHVTVFEPTGPGIVLLCSDGLWNYRPDPADLAGDAVAAAMTDPAAAAVRYVRSALDQGGQDNVTAAVLPFTPAAVAAVSPASPVPTEG